MNRRRFLGAAGLAASAPASTEKPALLGGRPARQRAAQPWPVFDHAEEQSVMSVLKSGKWWRGSGQMVKRFEEKYAQLTGARHCLAVANGTSALLCSLSALGIGAGDEVILPPYTFVATLNVILARQALPVFVDTNRDTFQMDAAKLEAAITPRTSAILLVHMAGSAADLDAVMALSKKHKIPLIEDACQAHLGEWRNRKVGTYGATGCFSFQASKNLNSGEGGAILTQEEDLFHRCSLFHNNSRGMHRQDSGFNYASPGLNLRMTEFQAALLVAQMTRIEEQSRVRETNARRLDTLLGSIPGLHPARLHSGCTRSAYHLYMFRYDKEQFSGLPREKFLKALAAEGVPASGGYTPLNKEPVIETALKTRGYERIYPAAALRQWPERNRCPENDKLCQEAVWLTQTVLLGDKADMERIAEAAAKIQKHAAALL
jgi:dTDP-4-amino-4,6-dideoxygalactose transaminase